MKLVDISHVLDENTPVFPGDYKTALSIYAVIEKDFYNAHLLQTCLHTGTHIDMPMHLVEDERTVAQFPLDAFYGRGVLLDVRGENPITMKPIYKETVREHDVVLLFTGFDANYGKDEYFTEHPAVSDELADFLLSRRIKILGMDMPSPDHPPYKFHRELLKAGILVLENLTNLQSMTGVGSFEVMALPIKIEAEASFVRAVCVTDNFR